MLTSRPRISLASASAASAPALADKHLSERNQRLSAKLLRMSLEIGTKLSLLRHWHRVLEQELHLLAQPASDDGVIFVQTERERGAIQNLLANVIAGFVPPVRPWRAGDARSARTPRPGG